MKVPSLSFALALPATLCIATALSQAQTANLQTANLKSSTPIAATAATSVPALVPFSGFAFVSDGKPLTGESATTFLIYKDEAGGEPLFAESQAVTFDATGHYKVQLGATLPSGIPLDLFTSGEARWLEVQIAGGAPQPRLLLASVPYALKAGDASTLGGLPASAYALAGSRTTGITGIAGTAVPEAITPNATTNVTTTGGTSGYLPVFTGASTVANSILFQNTTANGVGILGTPSTGAALDVFGKAVVRGIFNLSRQGNATTSTGYNSYPFIWNSSAYSTTTSGDVSPVFALEAEVVGNNTTAPSATFNLLYSHNAGNPGETGFYFNPNGTIHFASGQTFPGGTGTGTITGVTAGTDLTGGGTSGKVTLNVDTTKVPQLAANNTYSGSQTVKTNSSGTSVTVQNSDTSAGIGLKASGYTGLSSSGTEYGIQGTTTSGKAGIYGSIQGANSNGSGGYNGNAGVWGDTGGGPGTYIGVLGTAGNTAAGVFDNNSEANYYASVFAENDTTSNASASVISTLGGNYGGTCNIDVSGNISCSGTISGTNVAADRRVLQTYAMQSAENWYEDAGSGKLQSGTVHVSLDADFGAIVNSGVEYHVFLTPNGDCKGLYVSNKTATGFEVKELGSGASSVAFDYRIMAKRKGFEKVRMEDVTLRIRRQAEQRPSFPRRAAVATNTSIAPTRQGALKK